MEVYKMHEAKTNLSKMVEKAMAGEEVYISNRGNIKVQLTPVIQSQEKRKGGQWKGSVEIAENFELLPDEIANAFKGNMP